MTIVSFRKVQPEKDLSKMPNFSASVNFSRFKFPISGSVLTDSVDVGVSHVVGHKNVPFSARVFTKFTEAVSACSGLVDIVTGHIPQVYNAATDWLCSMIEELPSTLPSPASGASEHTTVVSDAASDGLCSIVMELPSATSLPARVSEPIAASTTFEMDGSFLEENKVLIYSETKLRY